MGRFSEPLAVQFAQLAGVQAGQRVLEVGCGPGPLTAQLLQRLGSGAVCAIDPSPSLLSAVRDGFPGVGVVRGVAEQLPFADRTFDAALAQLVVHFMTDAVYGLAEMGRVTRPGGTVAACVWDHAGGAGPLAAFWQAVHDLDPGARDEAALPGAREGQLAELCAAAGLRHIEPASLTIQIQFATFTDWWEASRRLCQPARPGAARSSAKPVRATPAPGPVPPLRFSLVRKSPRLTPGTLLSPAQRSCGTTHLH